MYCPVPDCDCGEVFSHFESERAPWPRRIVVQLSGAMEIEPSKNGRDRLEKLLDSVQGTASDLPDTSGPIASLVFQSIVA